MISYLWNVDSFLSKQTDDLRNSKWSVKTVRSDEILVFFKSKKIIKNFAIISGIFSDTFAPLSIPKLCAFGQYCFWTLQLPMKNVPQISDIFCDRPRGWRQCRTPYLLQSQMLFIKVYEHIMIHIHKSFQSINVSVYSYLKWRKMSEERQ